MPIQHTTTAATSVADVVTLCRNMPFNFTTECGELRAFEDEMRASLENMALSATVEMYEELVEASLLAATDAKAADARVADVNERIEVLEVECEWRANVADLERTARTALRELEMAAASAVTGEACC